VLYQGSLWARDTPEGNLVLDANTGNTIAAFSASAIPAFAGTRGFSLVGGALQALDISTRAVLWTFSPGALVSAPLVVNNRVYVGSSAGQLYAVDPATGMAVWMVTLPWGISATNEFGLGQPVTGMGAGGDALIVPAGNHLVCYR
jgi:outer membrane protein assembly factor BamB